MSIQAIMMRFMAARSDKKRDSAISLPEGVVQCRNISYGHYGENSMLDVYFPEGTAEPLPTIVSIHGGGYVYGTKEIYRRYGMDMARRGFAFVNFNYRLAPKWKFPTPLADANAVLQWVEKNARSYNLDPERIILIGDSAGAQLASQYAAIFTNPQYAANFDLKLPRVNIRAVGLYCGLYDVKALSGGKRTGLALDYLGKDISWEDPRLDVLGAVTESYPPAFIITSCEDFLRANAEPMWKFLKDKGIEAQWRCYGREGDKKVGHVFHVNIILPEARQCNGDAADFFRKHAG